MARLFLAFLRRDAMIHISYRLEFLLDALSILFSVATFYFVSRLFGAGTHQSLASYGGDYFPFVLVGLAFSAYQGVGLRALTQSLRQEQYMGTLEAILAAPIRIPSFLLSSIQWDLLQATFQVAVYFAAAFLVFGLKLPSANLPAAFLVLGLMLCAFIGLGTLSAAFILKFKRGDPAAWFISTISELLGGVYFPVALLPAWLRRLSPFIPMTPALEGLRRALLRGSSVSELSPQIFALAAFSLVLMPLGFFCFQRALESVKRDGSLGHY